MTAHCAVCSMTVARGESARYQISSVSGVLCGACRAGLDLAVGGWMTRRLRETERERAALERARAADERQCRRIVRGEMKFQKALRDEMFPDLVVPRVRREVSDAAE